jgi:hypothetical protein
MGPAIRGSISSFLAAGLKGQEDEMFQAELIIRCLIWSDTKRQATSGEVVSLRKENSQLKELVADLSLKNAVLKESLAGTDEGLDE